MKRFWWPIKPNFGDVLTPYILRHFRIPHTRVPNPASANALCIGSIAKFAKAGTHVYGSGFMSQNDPVAAKAVWHWVRGPYSRQKVLKAGGSCPELYGDPAMLLPLLWEPSEKIHEVGIVPHYVDFQDCRKMFPDLPVIDLVTHDCKEVVRQITSCKKIISSSLHGIIAAHAYGIPAAWVPFSDRLNGDGIKFRDHYASVGLEAKASTISNPDFQVGSLDIEPLVKAIKQ